MNIQKQEISDEQRLQDGLQGVQDVHTENVMERVTENYASTRLQRWRIFPNVLDFIFMLIWFSLSQLFAVMICGAFGLTLYDPSQLTGMEEPEILLSVQQYTAKSVGIIYSASMLLAIGGILVYRRLRGCRTRAARFSIAGFKPALILGGFIWMLAAEVVIEPLLLLMPDVPDTIGRGSFAIITTVMIAPLMEEFLCRGIVLESLRAKYGVIMAWIASSLFFALIHGHVTAGVNALVIGSIIGYIYLRSNSLFGAVILHAMNNMLAIATISLGMGDTTLSQLIPDNYYRITYLVAVAICTAGAVILAINLRKLRRKELEKAKNHAEQMQ